MANLNYDEMTSDDFRESFAKLRRKVDRVVDNADFVEREKVFFDLFTDIGVKAVDGDIIAQDYLGYIFKHGKEPYIPENIEIAMKWLILAGANGNKGTIKKLTLFLSYAMDEIMFAPDFLDFSERNGIYKETYDFVLGKLICEAIVDELKIDPLELTRQDITSVPYNEKSLRVFDRARNNAIPVVLNYLRS